MSQVALEQGLTGQEAISKAEEMGFECDVPEIKDFFQNYIDQHLSGAKTWSRQYKEPLGLFAPIFLTHVKCDLKNGLSYFATETERHRESQSEAA